MKLSKGPLPPRQWCVGLSSLVALAVFLVFGPDSRVGFVAPGEAARELPPAAGSQLPLMKAVSTPRPQPRLVQSYGKLPLSFEANQGQTDGQVKFLSRGRGYTLFLAANEAMLALRKPPAVSSEPSAKRAGTAGRAGVRPRRRVPSQARRVDPALAPEASGSAYLISRSAALPGFRNHKPQGESTDPALQEPPPAPAVLRLKLVGANPQAKVSGLDELPGKSNYFIGNDPKKWRTNVANYAKVRYQGVCHGIDLVYYGKESAARSQESEGRKGSPATRGTELEFDFVVAPGADPSAIRLALTPGPSP